jgi:hypothetical protein
MYDDVYATLVSASVAIKLDKEEWFDHESNTVQTEEDLFGRKTDIQVTRPDMIIMVDECGDKTLQKQDGNEGVRRR